jgi:molybdenum cofactor cytidylyltransferase
MAAAHSFRLLSTTAQRRGATCAVLILAAGGSRRLGRPKQLVRAQGTTLVARATALALALRPKWVGVVVGARAARVAAEVARLPVAVVRARHWRHGMAASLRAGIARLPRSASHVLVLSVDQWNIRIADLARLVTLCGRTPAAAGYAERAGIPAVFPRTWWRALTTLQGDRGARGLLEFPGTVRVPMPSAEGDLDTPAALRRFRECRR